MAYGFYQRAYDADRPRDYTAYRSYLPSQDLCFSH